jgi:hypothetical protein
MPRALCLGQAEVEGARRSNFERLERLDRLGGLDREFERQVRRRAAPLAPPHGLHVVC